MTDAGGYDAGGILSSGVTVSNATLRPMVSLDAEQIAAYERALELVARWEARDIPPAQSP